MAAGLAEECILQQASLAVIQIHSQDVGYVLDYDEPNR